MIKEAYVSFEVAKLLKEKGFDEDIHTWYKFEDGESEFVEAYIKISNTDFIANDEECYSAPTHQMACAWLKNKGIIIDILAQSNKTTSPEYMFNIWDYSVTQWNKHIYQYQPEFIEQEFEFTTYEEAVESALKYSLENLL